MEKDLTLYHKVKTFMTLKKRPFENIVGKGANAGNQHYLFPKCSLLYQRKID